MGIPDYLLGSGGTLGLLSLNATFAIHDDDTAIAEIVSRNGSTCEIRGLQLGSARVIITVNGSSATVIVAVAPSEEQFTLPAGEVRRLGEAEFRTAWWNNGEPDSLPSDIDEYNSEPSYQLAWNWRNSGSGDTVSGDYCGIDILGYFVDPAVENRRGWVRTTYDFGGWHYDLNGTTDNMVDGVQTEGDVTLKLTPEFVYDNGTPYLQITHTLTNNGTTALTDQKFGASADIMLFNQDDATLVHLPYGALMTNATNYGGVSYLATMKLRLVAQNIEAVTDVDTLWLGDYGVERSYVYDDQREDITAEEERDTALNFSYQGINLAAGESKRFVVRFTQVQ